MRNQRIARQRTLLHDGPDWQQLSKDVRQTIIRVLADLCLEVVNECVPGETYNDQEPCHESRKD